MIMGGRMRTGDGVEGAHWTLNSGVAWIEIPEALYIRYFHSQHIGDRKTCT